LHQSGAILTKKDMVRDVAFGRVCGVARHFYAAQPSHSDDLCKLRS